jgi:hypothetical protein
MDHSPHRRGAQSRLMNACTLVWKVIAAVLTVSFMIAIFVNLADDTQMVAWSLKRLRGQNKEPSFTLLFSGCSNGWQGRSMEDIQAAPRSEREFLSILQGPCSYNGDEWRSFMRSYTNKVPFLTLYQSHQLCSGIT